MWDVLLLFSSICTAVVVGDPETVIGHRGGRVDIRCSYESGYETHSKYFCKGECLTGFKNIIIKSGSPAKDERFSLTDDTTARVFTVTITDLRTEDEGQYWCNVERKGLDSFATDILSTDVYSEILLKVKLDKKTIGVLSFRSFSVTSESEMNPSADHQISSPDNTTTEDSTISSFSVTSESEMNPSTDHQIITSSTVASGGLFMIIIIIIIIIVIIITILFIIQKKRINRRSAVIEYENDDPRANTYAALDLKSRSSDLYDTLTTVHPRPAVDQSGSSKYENLSPQ